MKRLRRLRRLFSREKLDREMSEEMRAHLEMQTAANLRAGMPLREAAMAARRSFGGEEQLKEQCRDERWRGTRWLEDWSRDLRLAVRSLRRAPAFSLAVIATLALCIGPNTSILSVMYELMIRPLPIAGGERVVSMTNLATKGGGTKVQPSLAQYNDYRANADLFDLFVAFNGQSFTLGEENSPVRAEGLRAAPEWFDLFQQHPIVGRFFSAEEQQPGRDHVVVLTEVFWRSNYHADPQVVGREIRMGGESYTIIGVASNFGGNMMSTLRVIVPFLRGSYAEQPDARYLGEIKMIARLKPGVTLEAGRAQLALLEKRFYENRATPKVRTQVDRGGLQVNLGWARDELLVGIKTPLILLQLGAVCVLLIGCVNVVNLLLARANAKRLEFAVRHALGAGRAALLRQMVAESLILSCSAAVIGVGLAQAMMGMFTAYLPRVMKGAPPLSVDPRVLGFVILGAVVVAVAVGLVPFLVLWRTGLRVGDTRAAVGSRGARAIGGALVMLQVAFALVLLIGAGLMVRSMAKVLSVDPGFDAARVVQGRVALPMNNYRTREAQVEISERTLAAMRAIPGVEQAAMIGDFAIGPNFRPSPFLLRRSGDAVQGPSNEQAFLYSVSPDYFATMGIRLRDGRLLNEQDNMRTAPAVVVDEVFARKHFPERSAIGEEFLPGVNLPQPGQPWARIVGVVARANLSGLEARDGWPFVYYPIQQQGLGAYSILLRSTRPAGELTADMRAKLREIDSSLPLYSEGSLQSGLDDMLAGRRGSLVMLGIFAGMALLLAVLGIHGVLTYDVAQRTRELGIRAALGASRWQILRLVLRDGMMRTVIGVALGLAGAFLVTRTLRKFLFDVTTTDPVAFVGVALLFCAVALLASWLPARRAAKADPMVALRCE